MRRHRSIGPIYRKIILPAAHPKTGCPCAATIGTPRTRSISNCKTEVAALDAKGKELTLGDGSKIKFDKLLLATGAEPVKLRFPGADQPHVHTLRSLADCRAIIALAPNRPNARWSSARVSSASKPAAALRAREIEVHVVAPEKRPLERVFGPQLGDFIRALHEEHGVKFHLEDSVSAIEGKRVTAQEWQARSMPI